MDATILLALVLGLALGAGITFLIKYIKDKGAENEARKLINEAKKEAEQLKKDQLLEIKEESRQLKEEALEEVKLKNLMSLIRSIDNDNFYNMMLAIEAMNKKIKLFNKATNYVPSSSLILIV